MGAIRGGIGQCVTEHARYTACPGCIGQNQECGICVRGRVQWCRFGAGHVGLVAGDQGLRGLGSIPQKAQRAAMLHRFPVQRFRGEMQVGRAGAITVVVHGNAELLQLVEFGIG